MVGVRINGKVEDSEGEGLVQLVCISHDGVRHGMCDVCRPLNMDMYAGTRGG